MTKNHNIKNQSRKALLAGAAVTMTLAANSQAQSADALIDKLVDKGILTANEAKDLRDDADKNFNTAMQAKTGMPDWVSSYKISGDVRARYDQITAENSNFAQRNRFRYRLRFGIVANMLDNIEAGFRLGSGDSVGNPLSNNTTMENDFSKKPLWVDTAYGKWTPINNGGLMLSATVGKMDNPFVVTPMVFDADITPEGLAIQGSYALNDKNTLLFNGAGFVLDEESKNQHDPAMLGEQIILNTKWNDKWSSSVGLAAFEILNRDQLTTNNVPFNNQGNTRNASGALLNAYTPVVADASVTYTFDSAPLYNGAFPVKLAAEYMNNVTTSHNANGYWAGVTFGKAGAHKTWELTYRYEYLQADAWFDQMVDDDFGVYYRNAYTSGASGYFGGTNVKGHLVKLTYSLTDSLSFAFSAFANTMINAEATGKQQPTTETLRVFADVLYKF
ncbi:MAG TPA: putative porin [Verrucomicrobiae bacterium]